MAMNIYGELFDQLTIPERLEPDNIAKMLDEHMAAQGKRSAIVVTESSSKPVKATKPSKSSHSAAYRAIMSVAACAALVLGLMRYMSNEAPVNVEVPTPGSYASDYEDIHKTFQKYYVDDSNKTTLDTAIAEIEHSYNEADSEVDSDEVKDTPIVTTIPEENTPTDTTVSTPEEQPEEVTPDEVDEEFIDESVGVILPDISGYSIDTGIVADSGKLFVREGNAIRVFTTTPTLDLYAYIQPVCADNEIKTLVDFSVVGDRLAVVYSVETIEAYTASEELEGNIEETDSVLDAIITGTYSDDELVGSVSYSVETVIYQLDGDIAYIGYTQTQSGEYVGSVACDGGVYVVTDYSDYRNSPLVGVDDLDSYVPTYTVNGVKMHLAACDIFIPARITTTDYTVISGISLTKTQPETSIQALLGYEGRIILSDSAVYIFGYETETVTGTSVEIFTLTDGVVSGGGYAVLDGLALSGDGITLIDDLVVVSSIGDAGNGYYTTLRVYNEDLEIVSKVEFPALLTNVTRDSKIIYLSGSDKAYAVDLSNPYAPTLTDCDGEQDIADYLVAFEDGYVALIDDNGKLTLTKIIEDVNGELKQCCETVVYDGAYVSKALSNNALMYVSGNLVGVPYGYFDGLDYCYTYALYKSGVNGFELIGSFETHETNTAFEFGGAVEYGSSLYVFSQGRVYELSASEDALAFIAKADVIYSTYSGHNNW